MTDESKISKRYRDFAREEPPRHVDEAILAAARRAAETRPAPLVVPSGRRRWYFPLAAAAIIVLAVAVTMQIERQQPDLEVAEAPISQPPAPAREEPAAAAQAPAEEPRAFKPDPKPAPAQAPRPQRNAEVLADLQKAQKAPTSPAPPAAAPAPQDAIGGMRESRRADEAKPQARMEVQSVMRQKAAAESATLAMASPEQWLQGIDDLKRQGRHDEAEKQLAEFRKHYPDYRIPEAILEKFEKR